MTDKAEGQAERPERCGQCAAFEAANPDPLAVIGKCMATESDNYGWRRQYASEACAVGVRRHQTNRD